MKNYVKLFGLSLFMSAGVPSGFASYDLTQDPIDGDIKSRGISDEEFANLYNEDYENNPYFELIEFEEENPSDSALSPYHQINNHDNIYHDHGDPRASLVFDNDNSGLESEKDDRPIGNFSHSPEIDRSENKISGASSPAADSQTTQESLLTRSTITMSPLTTSTEQGDQDANRPPSRSAANETNTRFGNYFSSYGSGAYQGDWR